MSTYLYAGSYGGVEPLSRSSTTSRLVLKLISKWDTPELYKKEEEEEPAPLAETFGWFSLPASRMEGEFHIEAFKQAKLFLPKTLNEFIPWMKNNWDSREVFKMGIAIGQHEVTAEIYADAMSLLEIIVDKGETIYAL